MEAPLSVLLRDGTHAGAAIRLALKAEQVSISITKTPIVIPVARSTPTILDLGISRPAITVSGIVETVGGDATNVADNQFNGMESMSIGASAQTYYIPYKNYLENKLITWVSSASIDLQLEIGDATKPDWTSNTASTGGGIYKVAVQQMQFSVSPAMEDRWVYSIQFVAKLREGISF